MAEKLFYSMGEVSELFDVNPSLLRYWEEQFPKLQPKRNKKGNRLYSPQDVELLKTIYHLVKERGMKIEGARKALRGELRPGTVSRQAELMERLQRIRAQLVEVREELKADDELPADRAADIPAVSAAPAVPAAVASAEPVEAEAAETPAVAPSSAEPSSAEQPSSSRPRRKKEEGETKELFAFYEQSLF